MQLQSFGGRPWLDLALGMGTLFLFGGLRAAERHCARCGGSEQHHALAWLFVALGVGLIVWGGIR